MARKTLEMLGPFIYEEVDGNGECVLLPPYEK